MTEKKTWLIILSVHLLLGVIVVSKRDAIKVQLPNKIAVTTVQLQPPTILPKPAPQIKKAPAKKVVKTVSTTPKLIPTPLPTPPTPIKNLSIDQEKIDQSLKKIVQVMQTHLQLPEFGKVKLTLTLLADGSVKEIHVLDSESTPNKVYLETHLKELQFPPIEQGVLKKDEQIFHITFCNAT